MQKIDTYPQVGANGNLDWSGSYYRSQFFLAVRGIDADYDGYMDF